MNGEKRQPDRRAFLADSLRVAGALGVGGAMAALAVRKGRLGKLVWQLDPAKCIACGNCATHCVLDESAVKCVHSFVMCGYCDLCTGYFRPATTTLNSGAENQLCPTGAIQRSLRRGPLFRVHDRRAVVHRLRQVREGVQRLRQRLDLLAGAARPLSELQRVCDCGGLPLAGLPPRPGRRSLPPEDPPAERLRRRMRTLARVTFVLWLLAAPAATAVERFPPPDFTRARASGDGDPAAAGGVVRVSRSGGIGRRARPGLVFGDRKAFPPRAVGADHRLARVAGLLARGLHLSDRLDPERHAGNLRPGLCASLDGGRGLRAADPVYALLRADVLRRGLPVGGGAGVGRAAAGQRARLARPSAGSAELRLPWAGRVVCGLWGGLRRLPLRPFRGLLPPQRQREDARARYVLPDWGHFRRAAVLPLFMPLRRDTRARLEGVEVARQDSARRVHPVPAVRRSLPLRGDPRADRAAAGLRAAAQPAAVGPAVGRLPGCWWPPASGSAGNWKRRLARVHPTVRLAERVRLEQTGGVQGTTDSSDAFRNTGRPAEDLYREALALSGRFRMRRRLVRRLGGAGGRGEADLSLAPAAADAIISRIVRRASPAAVASGIAPASKPGKDGFNRLNRRDERKLEQRRLSACRAGRGRGRA